MAAYHAAVINADSPDESEDAPVNGAEPERWISPTLSAARSATSGKGDAPPARGLKPAVYRGRPITDYSQSQLRAMVRSIESDTLLRTQDELVDQVMRELGFNRRGKRIVDAISRAIAAERRAH